MKKARAWLDKAGVAYEFHDYKTAGIEKKQLEAWSKGGRLGNAAQPRRYDLPQAAREGQGRASTPPGRMKLMLEQPSMIKRPVLEHRQGAARRLQAG